MDGEVEPQDLESWAEKVQGNPGVVWHMEEDGCWEAVAKMKRITPTITNHKGPTGLWIELHHSASRQFKYPVRCRHHECPGPAYIRPVYIHLHGMG